MPMNEMWPKDTTPELPMKTCSAITMVRLMKSTMTMRSNTTLPSSWAARAMSRSGTTSKATVEYRRERSANREAIRLAPLR